MACVRIELTTLALLAPRSAYWANRPCVGRVFVLLQNYSYLLFLYISSSRIEFTWRKEKRFLNMSGIIVWSKIIYLLLSELVVFDFNDC